MAFFISAFVRDNIFFASAGYRSLLKCFWSSCSFSNIVCPFLFLLSRASTPSSPSFSSRFVARVQSVNEITRSNLWHQIPNENMIIVANAEYRARRTRLEFRKTADKWGQWFCPLRPIALPSIQSFGIAVTKKRDYTDKHVSKFSEISSSMRNLSVTCVKIHFYRLLSCRDVVLL